MKLIQHTLFRSILLLSLLFIAGQSMGQVNGNCRVQFNTVYKGKPYTIVSRDALLTLNSKSGDLTLKLNLTSLDAELDTLDAYFDTRNEDLVFTGNTATPLFSLLNQDENSGQNYPMEGTLALNRWVANCDGSFNLLKINNERDELLRNLRFSLFLTFKAKDLGLDKVLPGFTEDISLQINEAVVNVAD